MKVLSSAPRLPGLVGCDRCGGERCSPLDPRLAEGRDRRAEAAPELLDRGRRDRTRPTQRQRLNGVLTRPGRCAAGRAMADGDERPARGVADVDARRVPPTRARPHVRAWSAPSRTVAGPPPMASAASTRRRTCPRSAANPARSSGRPAPAGPAATGAVSSSPPVFAGAGFQPSGSRTASLEEDTSVAWPEPPPDRSATAAHPAATRSASPIAAGRAGRARGRRIAGRGRRIAGRGRRTFGRGIFKAGRGRCTFGRGMRTAGHGTLGRGRLTAGRVPFARGCPFRRSEGDPVGSALGAAPLVGDAAGFGVGRSAATDAARCRAGRRGGVFRFGIAAAAAVARAAGRSYRRRGSRAVATSITRERASGRSPHMLASRIAPSV